MNTTTEIITRVTTAPDVYGNGNGKMTTPPAEHEGLGFLRTIFAPGDRALIRPIETWIEKDRKCSRTDYKGTDYWLFGLNVNGVWVPGPTEGLAQKIERQLARSKAEKTNIFYGVCPRLGGDGAFDQAWQIRTVRVLWSDIDDCTPEEALTRIEAAGLPRYSIMVNSGHGCHVYWLLSEPYLIDDVGNPPRVHHEWIDQGEGKKKKRRPYILNGSTERVYIDIKSNVPALSPKAQHVQDVNAGIAAKVGGDHTQDLSRILRIPGTMNRKDERNGTQPIPCTLVECDPNRRYAFAEFERFAAESPDRKRREQVAKVPLPTQRKLTPGRRDKLAELILACGVTAVGQRSEADYAVCAWAIEHGVSQVEVWAAVQTVGKFAEGGERYFQVTWEKAAGKTREKIFAKATAKATGTKPKQTASGTATPADKPQILIGVDELRVTDEGVAALSRRTDIFQRGGVLVGIVQDAAPPKGIDRPKDAPRIAIIRRPRLQELLADAADWLTLGKEGPERCHPPEWTVKAVDARGEWHDIRRIEGVVEMPVLRADGTVLQTPGYDDRTGLMFAPRTTYPLVPDQPTLDDARRAWDALMEPVADFPFGNEVYQAAWVAGVLTPPARFAFAGPAPLNLVDANRAGTGKTLLMDTTGTILTGRPMARMTMPPTDEETRKRILAVAISAEPMILIDNIAGSLGSPSLDAALTATTWQDRILGRSEIVTLPLSAVWYATANNASIRGDTLRRVLPNRLQTMDERPEMRQGFKHSDLLGWIRQEHPRLATAAVCILAAYCAAGKPQADVQPWGSYEGWSGLVRQAVLWVSGIDPADARLELIQTGDEEASLLRRLITGWLEIDPSGSGVTVADALRILAEAEDEDRRSDCPGKYTTLRDTLDEIAPETDKRAKGSRASRIGYYLRRNHRRVIDGRYIDHAGETDAHVRLWGVKCAARG